MLDGNARMNLATFVSTWMEPQAEKLMAECLDKNMIDKDEYPQTAELEMRCVNILSRLWHAPDAAEAVGCSTTGSSEAAMLGGLALKRLWQHRRKADGKPVDRPNIVMGINVQVCWEKFANYWDVEMRLVPMEGNRFTLSAEEAVKLCDENTIGVVAILGSTFDGAYEPIAEICAALDELQERTGLDIPVHVDGASGAFVAPFADPDLVWDFRLPRVASINASGHKYGLVYPGVGWIIWRDAAALPEDLIFWVNYLGDNMPTFALNFSRPGAQVVAQYYNFLRLGFEGYRKVQLYSRAVATRLSAQIAEIGPFELITKGDELPVFAFKLKDEITNYTVFDVSNALARAGLAAAGVHVPGQPHRPRGAARRREAGLHPRHGRPAGEGHPSGSCRIYRRSRRRCGTHELVRVPPLRAPPTRLGRACRQAPARSPRKARGRSSRASVYEIDGIEREWDSRTYRKRGRLDATGVPGWCTRVVVDRGAVHGRLGVLRDRCSSRLCVPRRRRRHRSHVFRWLDLLHERRLPPVPRGRQYGGRAGSWAKPPPTRLVGAAPNRLACNRDSTRRHRLLQHQHVAGDDRELRRGTGEPALVAPRCTRLRLLSRRELARIRRGRTRLAVLAPGRPRLADRSPQPGRIDLLRVLGDRRLRRPLDRELLNAALANVGTLLGAIGFFIGAMLLLPEATKSIVSCDPLVGCRDRD